MSQLSDNLLLLAIISSQVILWRNTSALTPSRNKVSPKGLLLPEFMLLNLDVPGKWYLDRKILFFFPKQQKFTISQPLYMRSLSSVQFSSVIQSCSTLCDPMVCSTPGLPVHYQLPEFTQTHVHWIGDAVQSSHPLLSPSPPVFNLSQHQGLFKWVSSSHLMAKGLEFQLQHQCFQLIFRTDFL